MTTEKGGPMNVSKGGSREHDGQERITVSLPTEIAERLSSFCREKNVPPDRVVERALIEYLREGDMSH
jgi:metal-responsive CopG/Arc/MetJ family transcriptional regulator